MPGERDWSMIRELAVIGTSAGLSFFVRDVVFYYVEEGLGHEIPSNVKNLTTLVILAAANVVTEWAKHPNPELWSDAIMGTLAAGFLLYGSSRQSAVDRSR